MTRHVSDEERRARLAIRHGLAPSARLDTVEEVARAMTALHATAPATVHLSCWARTRSVRAPDVDRALYSERSVVKQLAMRRTLFAFPRDLIGAAWAGPAARVAGAQGRRMARDLVEAGLAADGEEWLDRARDEVLSALAGHPDGLTAGELRKQVPSIAVKVEPSKGEPWTASRVLVYLGARGDVMRGANLGGWQVSRPRWTLPRDWLGEAVPRPDAAGAYRELVRRWLWTFGPGTEEDLVWWLGSTKAAVRTALAELGAVEVSLDDEGSGWLLADDLDQPPDPGQWVSLLPLLDPTVMGWRGRDFFLGPHAERLFDSAGNAGTTAWVDGRVVGCWVQDEAGAVEVRPLEKLPATTVRSLRSEASRLTAWLDGVRLTPPLRSPAMRGEG